jgi:hypothetical protein
MCGRYRLDYIPLLIVNHATGELAYIFSLKKRHPKGGNRFCTTVYTICAEP